jgi:hypothetical protein
LNACTNWPTKAPTSVAVQFAELPGGAGVGDEAVTLLEALLVAGDAWGPDPVHAPISETDARNASERASRPTCPQRVLMPLAPAISSAAPRPIISLRLREFR